jgi:hypothetical protein
MAGDRRGLLDFAFRPADVPYLAVMTVIEAAAAVAVTSKTPMGLALIVVWSAPWWSLTAWGYARAARAARRELAAAQRDLAAARSWMN